MNALVLTLILLLVGCAAQGPLTYRPAQTSPQQTLLVNSKKLGQTVLPTAFEGQRDRVHSPGKTHSHGVGDRSPNLVKVFVTYLA